MDRQRGHLAVFLDRDDEQIERDAAVDLADAVGLDDQRLAPAAITQLAIVLVEPGEGPVVGGVGEQFARARPADAQRVLHPPVAMADEVTELGQHALVQPAQQLGILLVRDPVRIAHQRGLQLGPVGDRGAHILDRGAQQRLDRLPMLRIGARRLDVDHRFA